MNPLPALIGVEAGGTLFVRRIELAGWGRDLTLHCCYRGADGSDSTHALAFVDCRELRWRIYVAGDADVETPVVDAALGRDAHRSPAQILTAAFGLTLIYGGLVIRAGS